MEIALTYIYGIGRTRRAQDPAQEAERRSEREERTISTDDELDAHPPR